LATLEGWNAITPTRRDPPVAMFVALKIYASLGKCGGGAAAATNKTICNFAKST
jgi:hypothetical protein